MIVTPGMLNRRAEFYHQLGATIAAGVPLISALELAVKNSNIGSERKIVPLLIQQLHSGMTFSQSMVQTKGWMPEFDIALLSVGEQSGRLDSSFKILGSYYATRARIIRDTISDLIVTICTLHVFILIFPLGYLIAFVMGIMENNYAQCLPFALEKFAVFGILYTTVFLLIFACQGKRSERWRGVVESLSDLVPYLRTAVKFLALSRLAAALEALINAGVTIVQSWPLAVAASGSSRLKKRVSEWLPQFEHGRTPADMVNHTRYFPEMFANLYQTGEVSGKLDETLRRLQTYYQEEGFRNLATFTKIMNGTIYGMVALMVAISVIRFYVGYFNTALNSFQQ